MDHQLALLEKHSQVLRQCAASPLLYQVGSAPPSPSLAELVQAAQGLHEVLLVRQNSPVFLAARVLTNGAADIDLGVLRERYSTLAEDGDEETVTFVLEAASVAALMFAYSVRSKSARVMTPDGCLCAMVRFLEVPHEKTRIQALQYLARVCEQGDIMAHYVINHGSLVSTIALKLTAPATTSKQEMGALLKLARSLAQRTSMHAQSSLVSAVLGLFDRQLAQEPSSSGPDECILVPILDLFQAFSSGRARDMFAMTLDNQVPERVASMFQRAVLPSPPIVWAAARYLGSLASGGHHQLFLDVGGLLVLKSVLSGGLKEEVEVEIVKSIVWALSSFLQDGTGESIVRQLLSCHGTVWAVCNALLFLHGRGALRDEMTQFVNGLVGRVVHHPDLVRQTIREHHLLHVLCLTSTFAARHTPSSSLQHLNHILRVDGVLDFCPGYVHGLLQNKTFFPLVDQYRINHQHQPHGPFGMFSSLCYADRRFRNANLINVLVLLGVKFVPEGRLQVNFRRLPIYHRFRQAKVMVVLCATQTVARHRQKGVVDLPPELWRMVRDMLCEYGPL